MSKKYFLFISLFLLSVWTSAQDIKYFFKLLPSSYTNELNAKAKNSLLLNKEFRPPVTDSEEIVVYHLEELDTVKNFLRVEMTFESGQAGYSIIELRSFKTKTGNSIVVFSVVGGAHNMFNQNELVVFSYIKAKGLVQTSTLGLIPTVGIKNFVKPNTPVSMLKKYESYSSISYELGYEGENITLRLSEDFDLGHLDRTWLLGDAIEFVWQGDHFVRHKPIFKQ